MRLFALFFVLLTSIIALAEPPKAYFESNDSVFFKEQRVMVDGKDIRMTFFGYDGLSEAMGSNQQAAEYAKKYESYTSWANGLFLGGVALSVGYTLVTQNESDDDGESPYNSDTAFAIFGAGFIPAIILGGLAHGKLVKAMNHYNGVYKGLAPHGFKDDGKNEEPAQPDTVESSKLYILPTLNGIQLALTF